MLLPERMRAPIVECTFMALNSSAAVGPRLQQQVVGDADLADVVQPRGVADQRRLRRLEPQLEREQLARAADAVGVLARGVVAVLARERQPVEHLELGVLELGRPLLRRARAGDRCALQFDPQVARLQQVADAQQHLGDVDRLGQEIACAERERAALGVRRDVGREHEHRHPVRLVGQEGDVLEDLGAVAARHVPVEQQQVGRILAAAADDRERVGQDLDGAIARALEDRLQEQGVRLLVVDHEDPRRVQQVVVHRSVPPRIGQDRRECPHASKHRPFACAA